MLNNYIRLAGICVITAWLAGCASPASRQALVVNDASISDRHPYSVAINTSGGGETGAMDYVNISNEDLAGAIEDSIISSGLFSNVIKGDGADYKLNVALISMSKPMFGASFKVDMEMAWSLFNTQTDEVFMRESIKSSYTATMGDAFVGATRVRLAVEGAAQNNIRQGLSKISALTLN